MTAVAPDVRRIDTDVLVIGGGVAGCLAALACRERGLQVTVVDKGGSIDWAGSVGGGVDQFLTVMESGPEWDTPEFLARHLPELTDGVVDLAVSRRVIEEMPRMLRRLEGLGVDFRDPETGQYTRHSSFGLPGTYHLDFNGRKFKQTIGRATRKAGATPVVRTTAVALFESDGHVCGALLYGFRENVWTVARARAVILCTGDVNRISRNASGLPFDSWHLPYNTGDGHAMGFTAGAILANMEFIEATLTPRGFSAQGTNAFSGLGAHYLNRHGERFMLRYDPKAERSRRSVLVDAVIAEILAGNGPISMSIAHLPTVEIEHLEQTMGIDRYTLPGYFRQKGIDLHKDAIEITVSEFSIRRSGLYFRGSGLAIDEDGRTSVPGLFAAGDCSTVSGGIAGAATMGHLAGLGAASALAGTGRPPEIPTATIADAIERHGRPLARPGDVRFSELEDEVREIVTRFVGFRRTEGGLAGAVAALEELGHDAQRLRADTPHELLRASEAISIRLAAEVMARSALARRESRTGSSHLRVDYPQRDEAWNRFLVAFTADGRTQVDASPADQPIASYWKAGRAPAGASA